MPSANSITAIAVFVSALTCGILLATASGPTDLPSSAKQDQIEAQPDRSYAEEQPTLRIAGESATPSTSGRSGNNVSEKLAQRLVNRITTPVLPLSRRHWSV